jgi:hypothetical protein
MLEADFQTALVFGFIVTRDESNATNLTRQEDFVNECSDPNHLDGPHNVLQSDPPLKDAD